MKIEMTKETFGILKFVNFLEMLSLCFDIIFGNFVF